MAVSSSRWVVRLLLVAVLVGICALGGWTYWKGQPEYLWKSAQSAIAAADWPTAKIHLQKLVQKQPAHGDAHLALSEALLKEAEAAGQPATYAAVPQAMNELVEAARNLPDNLVLQKKLLAMYMETRQFKQAAAVAPAVLKHEEQNADALLALAWRAVDAKDSREAETHLARLETAEGRAVFESLTLRAQVDDAADDKAPLQRTLDEAVRAASDLTVEQLADQTLFEHVAMVQLLLMSVERAPDGAAAAARAERALAVFERHATTGEGDVRADRVVAAADEASQAVSILDARFPIPTNDPQEAALQVAQRDPPISKADELRQAAIETGKASPLVYHQSALVAIGRGDESRAIEILNQGIAAAENLPEARRNEALQLHLLIARRLIVARRFAEADPHIEALLAHRDLAGWGHLLAGSLALDEGRQEKALNHYLEAQRALGDTLQVRMALANTYLTLQKWQEALAHLKDLHVAFDKLADEERAWAEQHLGAEHRVDWGELRALLALGKWDDAQPHLEALQGTELEVRGWSMAVAYLWNNDRRRQADVLLTDVRRRFPKDLELVRLQVVMLREAGRQDEVEPLLSEVAQASPDSPTAQLLLCRWQMEQGEYEAALNGLTALEPRFGEQVRDRVAIASLKAETLMRDGRAEEALAIIEPLRADPETAAYAGFLEAAAEIRQQDWDAAAEALSVAMQANPRNGQLNVLQGELAAARGDYAAAIESLSASLDVTAVRDRARTTLFRSLIAMAQKSPEAVEAKVAELLQQYPDDIMVHMAKAELESQRSRWDEALASLQRIDELQPTSPTGAYLKATVWMRRDDATRAMEELNRALSLEATHLPSLLLATQAALALEQNTAALDFAQRALRRDARLWSTYILQAEALNRLERRDEASQVLVALTKAQPKMSQAHVALAGSYVQASQAAPTEAQAALLDKAIEALRAGQQKLPEEFGLVAAEVGLLAQNGRLEECRSAIDRIVGESPTLSQCVALGQAYDSASKFDEAKAWGERGLAVAADDGQRALAHLFLGNLTIKLGLPTRDMAVLTEAREHFAAIVASQPSNFIAGNNLAWLLADVFGDPAEAVEVAETVRGDATLEQLPSTFADTLALAYRKANRNEDALRLLQPLVAQRPTESLLQFQLGMTLAAENRAAEATKALEAALQLKLPEEQEAEARRKLEELLAAERPGADGAAQN